MKNNESGRSMIEMLGVLAIIAVLSVVGFYGFSQALEKWRIDKTVDQVMRMVVRLQTAFVAQSNYSSLGYSIEEINNVLANTGVVSNDMFVRDNHGAIKTPYTYKNVFKGNINVRVGNKYNSRDRGAFIIRFDSIPRQACITLASYAWGKSADSGYIAIAVNQAITDEVNYANCKSTPPTQEKRALQCYKDGVMLKEAAVRACRDERHNALEFMFY